MANSVCDDFSFRSSKHPIHRPMPGDAQEKNSLKANFIGNLGRCVPAFSAASHYLMRKWFLSASRKRKISAADNRLCATPRKAMLSGMSGTKRTGIAA